MTKQLEILWHALGVTQESRRPCRFHFVTGDGSGDHADCLAMVKLGLMQQHPPSCLTGGDDLFTVTDAGRHFALSSLPDPPKLTRSQKRYRAFLSADCGLTYREWLGIKPKAARPSMEDF